MGLRIIHPRQKYFYCFISMETCWKGFKIITYITFEMECLDDRKGHDGHFAKQVLKNYYS